MKTSFKNLCVATSAAALSLAALSANADPIPYNHVGTTAPYTPIMATGGDLTGIFAGHNASYHEQIGLYANGVFDSTLGYVFANQNTPLGTSVNFGSYAPGTNLIFADQVFATGTPFTVGTNPHTGGAEYFGTPTYTVYSTPTSSVGTNPDGFNHAYVTPFYNTTDSGKFVPPIVLPPSTGGVGTFVGFEDLVIAPFNTAYGVPASDRDYNDEQYVFSGLGARPTLTPESNGAILMVVALGPLAFIAAKRRRA